MTATRDELMHYLGSLGIHTQTIEHPAFFTVAEGRDHRAAMPGAHSKNLFLRDRKGRLFLVVAEAEAAIDLKQLHVAIGASGRLSFGSAELLLEVLGVAPGSVTPFAVLNDRAARVTVVLDATLVEAGAANFHPLVNTATTRIAVPDLLAFLEATGHRPSLIDFSKLLPAADL